MNEAHELSRRHLGDAESIYVSFGELPQLPNAADPSLRECVQALDSVLIQEPSQRLQTWFVLHIAQLSRDRDAQQKEAQPSNLAARGQNGNAEATG